MELQQSESERYQKIQLAAYYLWQQRGCPLGESEVDWFRAEQQLGRESEHAAKKPAIVAVAEAMGSALGSVAGLVASAGTLVHPNEDSGAE